MKGQAIAFVLGIVAASIALRYGLFGARSILLRPEQARALDHCSCASSSSSSGASSGAGT